MNEQILDTVNPTEDLQNTLDNNTTSPVQESAAEQPTQQAPEAVKNEVVEPVAEQEPQPEVDYNTLPREELLSALQAALQTSPSNLTKSTYDSMRAAFQEKTKAIREQQKAAFLEAGNDPQTYVQEDDPTATAFYALCDNYKAERAEQAKQQEAERAKNAEVKKEIIEKIKELLKKCASESPNTKAMRDLQEKWKNTGPAPQAEDEELWKVFRHNTNEFYNLVKLNVKLRNMNLKHNLEAKTKLCEQAEALMQEESVSNAFRALQHLHEEWKQLGAVDDEHRETIWARFQEATKAVKQRHAAFMDARKEEFAKNKELKEATLQKIEALTTESRTKGKEWDKAVKAMEKLQEEWREIGPCADKFHSALHKKYRELCDTFYAQRREYRTEERAQFAENTKAKEALCVEAEALQDSDNWRNTTDQLIRLQKQWKEIGPTQHRVGEQLWKRFRKACDTFFDRKAAHFSDVDATYAENLQKKKEVIAKINALEVTEDNATTVLDTIHALQSEWDSIGFVPLADKDTIYTEYKEAIDAKYALMNEEVQARERQQFQSRLEAMAQENSGQQRHKLNSERDKLVRKLQSIESEVSVLENNVRFFSRSKNAQALIAGVEKKIAAAKKEMDELSAKINMIDSMDQDAAE